MDRATIKAGLMDRRLPARNKNVNELPISPKRECLIVADYGTSCIQPAETLVGPGATATRQAPLGLMQQGASQLYRHPMNLGYFH